MLNFKKQQNIDGLIRRIYKTTVDPDEWQELLALLADLFRAHLAANIEQNTTGGSSKGLSFSGYTPESVAEYVSYYGAKSALLDDLKQNQESTVFIERLAPSYQRMLVSETYNDYHLKEGGAHGMSLLKANNGDNLSLTIFRREKRQGHYTEEEAQVAQLLLPHLVQASQISHKFALKDILTETFEKAFDQLAIPIVLIRKNNQVVYFNHAAEQLFYRDDGIKLKNKKLHAVDCDDNAKILKSLNDVFSLEKGDSQQASTDCMVRRHNTARPYKLTFMPLVSEVLRSNTADQLALITINDPNKQMVEQENRLAATYQLTPKEAKVVQAICNGLNTAEIATEFEISQNAVRFHTKNIFQKLHVNRQSDLVKLILTGPVGLLKPND